MVCQDTPEVSNASQNHDSDWRICGVFLRRRKHRCHYPAHKYWDALRLRAGVHRRNRPKGTGAAAPAEIPGAIRADHAVAGYRHVYLPDGRLATGDVASVSAVADYRADHLLHVW